MSFCLHCILGRQGVCLVVMEAITSCESRHYTSCRPGGTTVCLHLNLNYTYKIYESYHFCTGIKYVSNTCFTCNPSHHLIFVLYREKEKAEIKDRKVLDILANKDERIEELQKVLANQSKELTQVLNRKLEMQNELSKVESEREDLNTKYKELQEKVNESAN